LRWNNGENVQTVQIDPYNNCFTFRLAPGYKHFLAYCVEFKPDTGSNNQTSLLASATLIEDEEEEVKKARGPISWIPMVEKAEQPYSIYQPDWKGHRGYSQCRTISHEDDDDGQKMEADLAILLQYHHQFGHVSFQRLQELAKQGVIPRRLAKVPPPMCAACAYAKATRKPWRSKTRNDYEEIVYTQPGEMVSVDQLVSPTPGLVAQMTGKLTTSRYKYATVYMDHASRLGYVYLQKMADADETVKGKQAFEA